MSLLKKYWKEAVIGILLILLSLGGYSYKKVTKENESLHSQINSSDSHSVTVTTPMEVAGKVVYKTEIVHDVKTVTQTVTQIKTKEVTVTKRNLVSIGALWDFKDPMPKALVVDVNVFGPIGAIGQVQRDPWVGMVGLKYSF